MVLAGFSRDEGVRSLARAGLVRAEGVTSEGSEELTAEIERAVAALRAHLAGKTAGQMPHLRPARNLYRATGVEPTRHRPSPEALTRRLLRGDPFPRIHPAVDLGNLWAIESGLPVGLYDLDKLRGSAIELRLGREDESYEGIRKGEIHVAGRLVVADADGAFGNPSADSLRTSVDSGTSRCLYVLFAPEEVDIGTIDRWTAWLRERLEALLGAEAISAVVG